MSKIIPEQIHVVGLTVYKSNVNATDEYLNNPIEPSSIEVKYAQDSSFNFEQKAIRVRLSIILIANDQDQNEIGLTGEYGIEFHFAIDNMLDFIDEKENVSGKLGGVIMGIAYSTARGIILERTQGTFFNGVIMPIIDPKNLL